MTELTPDSCTIPFKKGKKRKNGTPELREWKNLDLSDIQLEGFEDGCVFEIEELVDYHICSSNDRAAFKIDTPNSTDRPELNLTNNDAKPREDKAIPCEISRTETTTQASVKPKKAKKKKKKPRNALETEKDADSSPENEKKLPDLEQVCKNWEAFNLHHTILEALHDNKFLAPTVIQRKAIAAALIQREDVVGIASTGSGKTLAFGIPILQHFLNKTSGALKSHPGCKALIIAPTRELALQIQKHLKAMLKDGSIGISVLVGGMSLQKQERVLSYEPEIVIATPGRLWDIVQNGNKHFENLHLSLEFLVVDEADRMLQTGSYKDLEKLLKLINSKPASTKASRGGDSDAEDKKTLLREDAVNTRQFDLRGNKAQSRQTFLFSATMTGKCHNRKKQSKGKTNTLDMLHTVIQRVGFRKKPTIIDLSMHTRTSEALPQSPSQSKAQSSSLEVTLPEGLELCEYRVLETTRDNYLYYFLEQYPGRTIVFLNSINHVRQLHSLLELLELPVFSLHAEMQQRQRLKKLDQFKLHCQGILVATDVAARGLDIPNVDYVVHYHIAKTPEMFIHRSGRTARGTAKGFSISLVTTKETRYHSEICQFLKRPLGMAQFSFNHRFLHPIQERVRLANLVSRHDRMQGKAHSDKTWLTQMAAAADIEIDDDVIKGMNLKPASDPSSSQALVHKAKIRLKQLLKEPLRPIGSTRKFFTLHADMGASLTKDGEYRTRDASDDLQINTKEDHKRFRLK
uniref:DEAD/DEAH box RNA helicase putative n=1 Tax=Albugo laibachii Nc14 TaxID=890382 RepID=F0WGW7_9STRA|nr:DEAD/DEAH box RNA helicase putative [Albugo laibachii Nc14]|eukprot:CCA20482.1 DEAD/DEAH box RNA helicase putative [Albugo laibachii Nc14]